MRHIFWAGDSTVATNKASTYPQTGIGQAFDRFTAMDVAVCNRAVNGRSTKSFIDESRLAPIYNEITKGDFLFIQFGHNDENPDYPDGVKLSIFLGEEELKAVDVAAFEGDGNDNKVSFMMDKLDVKRGDKLSFVIDAGNNISFDAGRLSVSIYEAKQKPEGEEARTNYTNLYDAFGEQGSDGWYYGMCDWNGANFEELEYDSENNRYYNDGKPELKADFVEPGNGRNAAYQWEVAQTGTIRVKGEYTKFANDEDPEANGVCMRIFINGEEKKWLGGETQGNFSTVAVKGFDEEYTVHEGDILMFAIDPDGNDSYDGGRLSVTIEAIE